MYYEIQTHNIIFYILCKYDLPSPNFFCYRRILFDLEICAKQYNNDNLITTAISMPTTYIT